MIQNFKDRIREADDRYINKNRVDFKVPDYSGSTYYVEVAKSSYFHALTVLRHFIKRACDIYWGDIQNAFNVDLFMITQSVSSPMGPGSDSEAINIKFGESNAFLVDSSQFGFEPLLLNGIKKVYCYLPSFRGENTNNRHLSQFYHCEAEISGTLEDLKPQVEDFVRFLAETLISMPNILNLLSTSAQASVDKLNLLLQSKKFQEIEFDEAIKILKDSGFNSLINESRFGTDITSEGELKLMEILKIETPIWVNHYDRDRVAFYQKPYKNNKVVNADLLFPQIVNNSFGGEIIGSGQRQDNVEEMYESITRQNLDPKPYEWYIDLRRLEHYKPTSGFGLGIERFIAWSLCRDRIQDVVLYPRLKNSLYLP